ncbi:MAG: hypothetical protein ACR2M1_05685 [Gemmatimonadaceae bacterium]
MTHIMGDPNMATDRTALTDVLETYAASEPGPSRTTLPEWVRRYPQYAQQLTEFTARWGLLEWVPDRIDDDETDEQTLVLRGMSTVQSVLFRRQLVVESDTQDHSLATQPVEHRSTEAQSVQMDDVPRDVPVEVERPIAGLLTEGKRLGITADDLAERVGVSDSILRKLDRRLINPASIPTRITRDLGLALNCDVVQIASYVQLPPIFAEGAQHRANQAPALPTAQEDFFDAVRRDRTLTEERKALLLSLAGARECDQ